MSWRTVKLGELVENFSVRAKDFGGAKGLDFYGVSNEEGIIKTKYAAEDKAEDYKIIEKGCFAYNPYRVNVGSIGLVSDETRGLISPAYVIFKPKPKSIIPELLFKFLKSAEGLRQIIFYARGTVRQALRFEDLCNIEISIPDYSEQQGLYNKLINSQKSSNILDAELKNQMELLKKLRHQLLQDALQGKLVEQNKKNKPASELLKKIKTERLNRDAALARPKKEKPLPPIKPEEIPFEIPENWVWCRLGEICDTRLGKMLDGTKNKGEYYPYFRNLNVQWYRFELDDVLQMKFEESELEEYSVKKGDLLICEGGYPGRGAIWESEDETFKFQKAIHRVRFYSRIPAKLYLSYLDLICSNGKIKDYLTGSGIQHLTGISLKKMPIPLPPLTEQNRIVQKLDKLMQHCNELEASIKQSESQNEKLLQQVLREALRKEPDEV
ncbi:MAG: restriction endonuclease subunit S [Saprospiraceae bacterium]|nr:restriction endonuclease subunit S [Saprospiraceae bacterium]